MNEKQTQTAPADATAEWIQTQTNSACEAVRLGRIGYLPVVPKPPLSAGIPPMGLITERAYLVGSLAEIEALARAIRKRNKALNIPPNKLRSQPHIIRNVTARLTAFGSIQIGSSSVWHPATL